MDTDSSLDGSSSSATRVSSTWPHEQELLKRLRRLPATRFEQVAQRLQQRDLVTLAHFASAPHALVHHVLAALQTVLLSLSLLHDTTNSGLRVAPWPLLRLDVLANVDVIWRKMWKRLARLRRPRSDPRRKPLASDQVRFVVELLLRQTPGLASVDSETWDSILETVGRVSAIAESIAAFVLLCVHYSLEPPAFSKATSSPNKPWLLVSAPFEIQPGRSSPKRLLPIGPLVPTTHGLTNQKPHSHTWRCGLKLRGRFFLFQAAIAADGDASGQTASGMLSAFALNCRHAALEWKQVVSAAADDRDLDPKRRHRPGEHDVAYARSWMKRAPMPPSIARLITADRRNQRPLDKTTALSLLLQTSVGVAVFTPPGLFSLLGPTATCNHRPTIDGPFTMHVIFVATENEPSARGAELKLVAIGDIRLHGIELTVSDVRRELVASKLHLRDGRPVPSSALRFFVHGILVPVEEEPWRLAIELLPFAIVGVDEPLAHSRHSGKVHDSRKRWRPWSSSLLELTRVVGSFLSKTPTLQHVAEPAATVPRVTVSVYGLNQSIASLPATSELSVSSSAHALVSSATDTLLTLLANWSAFVQFQQLQDTTAILYEYGSPQKPPPVLRPAITNFTENDEAEEKLRPEPTAAELELQSLPHEPFRPDRAYLKPLYATFTYRNRRKAYLRSPCLPEVEREMVSASKSTPVRLAVEKEECVVHVTSVSQRSDPQHHGHYLVVRFTRDRSCPLEMLMTMRDAFVWCVTKLPTRNIDVALDCDADATVPPRWLRDVLRFVTHATHDFSVHGKAAAPSSSWPFPSRFFHVDVPYFLIEQTVEARLWSRGIDWWPHWRDSNVEQDLLRPKYDAMCRAYPPSFAIDSVKFSKFLRECGLQPTYLTVGDAAFLFTAHRAPGSHYEMVYDGFVDAMRWIAFRVPPSRSEYDTTHQLRSFCFEWLIRAPSMNEIWRQVVDRWRLEEKLRFMETAAIAYCAATRIQANWKRLLTRRALITVLTRLKNERRAAAQVQSLYKMRKVHTYFVQLKTCVLQVQRFLRARRELRQLRRERAALVEQMRLRLQTWMRQRLRVLRCWKIINAAWLARRARILEKRSRLVCAAAYQIDSQLYRASLYRIAVSTTSPRSPSHGTGMEALPDEMEYELELLEPRTSWFRSIHVSRDTFDVLENEAQTILSMTKPVHARQRNRWKLLVLMQRLHLKGKRSNKIKPRRSEPHASSDCVVHIYRDPVETSLGRVLYQGTVEERSFHPGVKSSPTFRFVRLLVRAHDFTLVTYAPATSTTHRFTFTTAFAYQLFHVARLHQRGDFCIATSTLNMAARSVVIDALAVCPTKLLTIRFLLRYLVEYGTTPATHDMMTEAIERRLQEQRESDECVMRAQQQRHLNLIIVAQTAVRRLLATRHVQGLALRSYTKSLDPALGRFVYTYRRFHDVLTYTEKPRSLRDKDATDPVDEWILSETPVSPEMCYFNPLRGVFSRVNDVIATVRLQRWFRRVMWTRGFPPWDLRHLSLALLFHRDTRPPSDLSALPQLEQITRYALHKHLLDHDYKTASSLYEAALALESDHVPALVGLAVLLIYSCRYPAKQTWTRGLQLLDTAKRVNLDLRTALTDIEQNCFRWAMFLHAKNADAFGNYAVFVQCVRGDLDTAEVLYRRAIDVDPTNEYIIENYLRLQRERTPEGIYSAAGPSKIAVWRAEEIRRIANTDWRELQDTSARFPSGTCFFQNLRTGMCSWTLPTEEIEFKPTILIE